MKTISIQTTTTLIVDTEPVKPTSPCWTFVNTGEGKLIVNENTTLLPNGVFTGGIDTSAYALLVAQGFDVKNETSLRIKFSDVSKPDIISKSQGRGILIQQFITLR
jgi:hypothetical protein